MNPQDKAFDVFISHSSQDGHLGSAIKQHLQGLGIRCWKAPDDIMAGESWPAAIMRALGSSKVMLLVWTKHSMSSQEVSKELTLAMKNGLIVLPFRLDDVQPTAEWDYHLANTHWLDATAGKLEDYLDELARRVLLLVPPTRATPEAVSPAQPVAAEQGPRPEVTALPVIGPSSPRAIDEPPAARAPQVEAQKIAVPEQDLPPNSPPPKPPSKHLVWAVLGTVIGSLGCGFGTIPGIIALVCSVQVGAKSARGEHQSAARSSRNALIWSIVAAVIGLLTILFIGVAALIGASVPDDAEDASEAVQRSAAQNWLP